MIIEYPEYYNRFRCIADRCPDTCCAGWEVDVDEDMYYYYKVVPGKIGEKIRSHMVEDGDEKYFPLTKEGRCPFLDDKNLCEIYSALGEESLCRVCTEYPRYYMEIGNYEQIDLSVSCMELGRLLFSDSGKIVYERMEDPADGEEISEEQEALLQQLIEGRDAAIAALQDRSLPLNERLAVLGITPLSAITETRDSSGFAEAADPSDIAMSEIRDLLPLLHQLEVLGSGWTEILAEIDSRQAELPSLICALYHAGCAELPLWFEKIAVYLVWRYWIDGWFEEDPLVLSSRRLIERSLILMEIMSALRCEHNDGVFRLEDMIDIAHIYSRQVEHSDDNVELFKAIADYE